MLNIHDISDAISEVAQGKLSVEEFERWFRRESRNVHSCDNDCLINAVLSIESVLSEYRFADMAENTVNLELARAIRPFALLHSSTVVVYEKPKERRIVQFAAAAAVGMMMYIPPTNSLGASSAVNTGAILPLVGSAFMNTASTTEPEPIPAES